MMEGGRDSIELKRETEREKRGCIYIQRETHTHTNTHTNTHTHR